MSRMAVNTRRHVRIISVAEPLTVDRRPILRHLIHAEPGVELPHERCVGVTAATHGGELSAIGYAQEAGKGVQIGLSSAPVARETAETDL